MARHQTAFGHFYEGILVFFGKAGRYVNDHVYFINNIFIDVPHGVQRQIDVFRQGVLFEKI